MCAQTITPREDASLRHHYEVERELATRLRNATREQRKNLYKEVYNELFQRVADHPQNMWKSTPGEQQRRADRQIGLLRHLMRPDTVYMEVGAGDCYLAMEVAKLVSHSYGVDVSDVIAGAENAPKNFTLVLTDGVRLNIPSDKVTLAYSNQLMEHLHPDDAAVQLQEVFRTLAPGGRYLCITPHRFSGPHDISAFFANEAEGFHLKEYTYRELDSLFRRVGFARTSVWAGLKGRFFQVPAPLVRMSESLLGLLPARVRRSITGSKILRPVFGEIRICGHKAA